MTLKLKRKAQSDMTKRVRGKGEKMKKDKTE
jgi:hypothetical protein